MDAVFYNRDQTHRISVPLEFEIERYSWNMVGGPQVAHLNAPQTADDWDWMKLLRAPVEIWDEGKCLWWGYVNRVTVPTGDEQRVGLGLDELYNYVTVAYSDGDTAAASDTESIGEYGQKETRLNDFNATQTEAEQTRGIYLADHQYARPEIEFSGGDNTVSLECYGWYSTLGWKYYSSSDESNVENTTQISSIITSAGQFLRGAIIEDISSTTSNAFRDGTQTALTYINQLLNAGTTNTRPLLAYVDRNRYLHVYERQAEPPTNQPDYLMRSDSKLITPLGQVIPDKECKTAVWVRVRDVPNSLAGFSDMRPFYLESAEYNVAQNKTTYRAANSYEQVRLAKYISETISGNHGGSGGVIGDTGLFYPYLPANTARRPTLCRAFSGSSDIAMGDTYYINMTGSIGVYGDFSYNGVTYMSPGTDAAGNNGMELHVSGVYYFDVYVNVGDGSTPPTTGNWILQLKKRRLGGAGYTILPKTLTPFDPAGFGYCTVTVRRRFNAGDFFNMEVVNSTDGDIVVSYSEFVGILEYPLGAAST